MSFSKFTSEVTALEVTVSVTISKVHAKLKMELEFWALPPLRDCYSFIEFCSGLFSSSEFTKSKDRIQVQNLELMMMCDNSFQNGRCQDLKIWFVYTSAKTLC